MLLKMKKLPTLYKLDSKGKTREWNIVVENDSFWTESGIVGMKMNVSKPTNCKGKNIGRSNETSSVEQALAEAEAKWESKRKSGYTQDKDSVKDKKFYEPMLAHTYEKNKTELKFPVFTQPKLDGIRCIISKENGKLIAKTRNGRQIDSIPHILRDVQTLFGQDDNLILDGELYNHDLKENFNKITSLVRKQKPQRTSSDTEASFDKKEADFEEHLNESSKLIQYWIYDSPRIAGFAEDMDFSVRQETLSTLLSFSSSVVLVPTTEVHALHSLDNIYERYLADGYEGKMIRLDKPYENKRSKSLLKRKEFQDAEYKVLDIDEGNGNRKGTAKHLVCICSKTNKVFHSNIKGDFEYLKEILENKDNYIGKYATIKYFQLTPDGIPRFPYALSFRDYE